MAHDNSLYDENEDRYRLYRNGDPAQFICLSTASRDIPYSWLEDTTFNLVTTFRARAVIQHRELCEAVIMSYDLDIPADRLTDAVDAILYSMDQLRSADGFLRPSTVLGTSRQPEAWCDFTAFEILEAERFLARCGMLLN